MLIKRVQAWWVRVPIDTDRQHHSDFGQVSTFDAAIVRVETDDGIIGWGEGKNAAGSTGTYGALVHLINREVAPLLVGRDPRDINAIWEMLYNGERYELASAAGHAMPRLARRGLTVGGNQRRRHRIVGHFRKITRRARLAVAWRPQGRAYAGLCLGRVGAC